jgi:hypothetical protein
LFLLLQNILFIQLGNFNARGKIFLCSKEK